jgi:tetratricopeptide (TPR) repeat protein
VVQLALGNAPEALAHFKKELSILEGFPARDNAKLAYAHYHVALALDRQGDPRHALTEYRQAEKLMIQPHDHIGRDFLTKEYAGALKQMYQSHAALLKQTGDSHAAAELEHRADALP